MSVRIEPPDLPPSLHAHRLLGDGTCAALVTNDGVVDWWCAPRFDSPPLLWSLLDRRGGAARWCGVTFVDADPTPAGPCVTTVVDVDDERVTLRDGLVRVDGGVALVRLVRAARNEREMRHRLSLGGFDGAIADWGRHRVAEVPLHVVGGESSVEHGHLATAVQASPHEWRGVAIVVGAGAPPSIERLVAQLEQSLDAWRRQRRPLLPRSHRDRVVDALAVVDACTFDPTGAVIASPTTSLPEAPGGTRQFDYRYSWMRDSALAVSLAALMGRRDIAERYLAFATDHILAEDDPCPCPLVAVDAEPVPEERLVSGVEGWARSTPIRVGNAARDQVQHDAWGLLCEAVMVLQRAGGRLSPRTLELTGRLADAVCDHQGEPTHGIWEMRRPREFVAADIGRWLVLDRALRIAQRRRPWRTNARWRAARDEARDKVLGAIRDDGFLPQTYEPGDTRCDASALMAVTHGLIPRGDPRARRVVEYTIHALEAGPWLRRYEPARDDGFVGDEGAFIPASGWAVEALAAIGDVDAAQRRADDLCARSPRLVSEEVDPATDVMLGNTPLVWSHTGMATALYSIDEARRRRRFGAPGVAIWRGLRLIRGRLPL